MAKRRGGEKVYKRIQVVGVSGRSFEGAIQAAVKKAAKTLRGLSWFEVLEQRGYLDGGKIVEYQVRLAVNFELQG